MASTLKDKIDRHERIICAQKERKESWKSHANKVNNELLPMLEKLNADIIEASKCYDVSLTSQDIQRLLKPE